MITKRNGNGQTECVGCKEKGKWALTWDSWLYNFNDKPYCFECLLENLEDLQQENQQLKEQNKSLRKEIKIHSKKSNGRYRAIKILEKHISKLNLECQRYFDCLMDVDEKNKQRDEVIEKLNLLNKFHEEWIKNVAKVVKYKGVDD